MRFQINYPILNFINDALSFSQTELINRFHFQFKVLVKIK